MQHNTCYVALEYFHFLHIISYEKIVPVSARLTLYFFLIKVLTVTSNASFEATITPNELFALVIAV